MRSGDSLLLILVIAACGGQSTRTVGGTGGSGDDGDGGTTPASNTGGTGEAPSTGGSTTPFGGSGGTVARGGSGGAVAGGGTTSGSGGRGSIYPVGGRGPSAGRANLTAGSGNVGMAGMPDTECSEDPYIGVWRGDGDVELVLSRDGDELVGTFAVGFAPSTPPPTDANEPWPDGYWTDDVLFSYPMQPGITSGFTYTVLHAEGCNYVARFSIATPEPWQAWCALQTPLLSGDDDWACILRGNGSSINHVDGCTTYRDGKLLASYPEFMCAACGGDPTIGYCACTEDACSAHMAWTRDLVLRLSSDDEGMLGGLDTGSVVVRR